MNTPICPSGSTRDVKFASSPVYVYLRRARVSVYPPRDRECLPRVYVHIILICVRAIRVEPRPIIVKRRAEDLSTVSDLSVST